MEIKKLNQYMNTTMEKKGDILTLTLEFGETKNRLIGKVINGIEFIICDDVLTKKRIKLSISNVNVHEKCFITID